MQLVSVIIPVYNVENYIDRCLESVANQTYKNIEILVMEAKSTDSSLEKVLKWAKEDDRFTVVSRRDGGLGPARNYAVRLAKGEFVVFLDSDDWLDLDFIEKSMYLINQEPQIDMVMTGFYMHMEDKNQVNTCINPLINGIYDSIEMKKHILVYGNNSMWSKLIRRTLLTTNKIEQPALPFEDLAVYPTLVAASRKIAVCNDTFMHYLAERAGSLFSKNESYLKFETVMKYGENLLCKVEGYKIFEKAFCFLMYRHFQRIYYKCVDPARYEYTVSQECKKPYFKQHFERIIKTNQLSYIAYGSFPLRWTIHRLHEGKGKEKLRKHYVFTGLIAQMSEKTVEMSFHLHNNFRQQALQDDFYRALAVSLSSDNIIDKKKMILIDFLMECHDIVEVQKNCYITVSEAALEANPDLCEQYTVITWNTDLFWELWKESCERFIKLLKESFQIENIILIKYFMADKYKYDKKMKQYIHSAEIYEKNKRLSQMYDFFMEQLPEICCYEIESNLLYTDMRNQDLKESPEYLNAHMYNLMAQKVELGLMERDE